MNHFIKALSLCLLMGCLGNHAYGSDTDSLFSRHRLQLLFVNGGLLNKAKMVSGEYSPETTISFSHSFHANYQWLITEKINLRVGLGLGRQAFSSYVNPLDEAIRNRVVLFADYASYFSFRHLSAEAAYSFKIGARHKLGLFIGSGAMRLRPAYAGYTSMVDDHELSRFNLQTTGKWLPFAVVGTELYRSLRNADQLLFRVHYQHNFNDWYHGTYQIHEGIASGNVFSRGSRISFGVGYVFTGVAKAQKLHPEALKLGSRSEAKRALRIARRSIDPTSAFLTVYGGIALPQTTFIDPKRVFVRNMFPAKAFMVNFEKGFGNNFFAEGGYHTHLYMASSTPQRDRPYGSGWSAMNMHNISMGGGYRLCYNQNVPILNFHAGLLAGFHTGGVGIAGYGSSTRINLETMDTISHIEYTGYTKSSFGPGIYAALSKDIRLSNRLQLSARVRYQAGFRRFFEIDVTYREPMKQNASGDALGVFRNSSYYALIGLKYRF